MSPCQAPQAEHPAVDPVGLEDSGVQEADIICYASDVWGLYPTCLGCQACPVEAAVVPAGEQGDTAYPSYPEYTYPDEPVSLPPPPVQEPAEPSLPEAVRPQALQAKKTEPPPAAESISHEVAMGRLRRLFQPRANGKYKVPDDLVKKWNDPEGKEEIIAEFAKTGFRKDWGVGCACPLYTCICNEISNIKKYIYPQAPY